MSWRYVQLIFFLQNTCVYQRKSGQNNQFFSEKAGKMPFNFSEKAGKINRIAVRPKGDKKSKLSKL